MSSDFLHKPPIFLGQDRLPSRFQDQLDTLAREKDPELYFHGLLNLGRELKGHLQEEKALAVFQSLLSEEKLPEEIRKNATLESEAILGQGSVGMRLEQLGSRFFQDAGRWNSASMRPQHFAAEEISRFHL